MKKTLYFAFTILCVCLFAGCSDDDNNGNSAYYGQIEGEWHLSVWNGATPVDFDAYAAFNDDRSFVIYQKVDSPRWESYSGSYRLDDVTLSGVYSDGTPWGSSYQVTFDVAKKTMTLTSDTSLAEVSVYASEAIPASVKGNATVMKSSRSGGFRLF